MLLTALAWVRGMCKKTARWCFRGFLNHGQSRPQWGWDEQNCRSFFNRAYKARPLPDSAHSVGFLPQKPHPDTMNDTRKPGLTALDEDDTSQADDGDTARTTAPE